MEVNIGTKKNPVLFKFQDFKGRKPAMDYDVASAGSSDEEEDPKAFGFETGV